MRSGCVPQSPSLPPPADLDPRSEQLRTTIEKLASTIQAKQATHDGLEEQIKRVSDENRKYYAQVRSPSASLDIIS